MASRDTPNSRSATRISAAESLCLAPGPLSVRAASLLTSPTSFRNSKHAAISIPQLKLITVIHCTARHPWFWRATIAVARASAAMAALPRIDRKGLAAMAIPPSIERKNARRFASALITDKILAVAEIKIHQSRYGPDS